VRGGSSEPARETAIPLEFKALPFEWMCGTATAMNASEHDKTGEMLDDFAIQLEKRVTERTLQLQNAVTQLEKEVADCKNIQTELHVLSRVFRDAADSILI